MSPRIDKQVPRNVMRVSAAFTGVTAFAVAFAPAASAQTGREAAPGRALSIRWTSGTYCRNDPNWFHLYLSHGGVVCMGGLSSFDWPLPGFPAAGFCGGNNYGFFAGWSPYFNHPYYSVGFNAGTTEYKFAGNTKKFPYGKVMVDRIFLYGWSGDDKCPY
jgi:hypothetical protein